MIQLDTKIFEDVVGFILVIVAYLFKLTFRPSTIEIKLIARSLTFFISFFSTLIMRSKYSDSHMHIDKIKEEFSHLVHKFEKKRRG